MKNQLFLGQKNIKKNKIKLYGLECCLTRVEGYRTSHLLFVFVKIRLDATSLDREMARHPFEKEIEKKKINYMICDLKKYLLLKKK